MTLSGIGLKTVTTCKNPIRKEFLSALKLTNYTYPLTSEIDNGGTGIDKTACAGSSQDQNEEYQED